MNRSEHFGSLPPGQAARLAALLDALGGIPVSDAERASLTWLAGFEAHTVANIAGVIRRARDRSAVVSRHREANRAVTAAAGYRRQLLDLCSRVGIDPGADPHAALLGHLRGREPGRGQP